MEITCVEVSCPLFNFENGPFSFSDRQLEDISEKYCCPLETVKYCARTKRVLFYLYDQEQICYKTIKGNTLLLIERR